jgi:cardiolipin synthase
MAIVPFVVLAINDGDFKLALWIFALAGITDMLDGWLARRLEMGSLIGAYLDPIADKLLLTAAYIMLTIPQGQEVAIPLWLAILALFRDFLILLVALVLFLVEGIERFPPSVLGKATTTLHVVTVVLVLLANVVPVSPWLLNICFYVSFGLVMLSGFNYIYRSSRFIEEAREMKEAREKRKAKRSGDGGEDGDAENDDRAETEHPTGGSESEHGPDGVE